MEWTKTDQVVKNLLYECIAHLGGLSDILGTIGSWKETISDTQAASSLQCWLDVRKSNTPNPQEERDS